jgi:hypothetical protein
VNTVPTTFGAGNYWSGISQIIETTNMYDMQGSASTVSFIFASNIAGTFAVCIQDMAQTKSFVQTFTVLAGTPTRIIVPVPAMPQYGYTSTNLGGLRVWIGFLNQSTYLHTAPGTFITGNYLTTSSCTNWAGTIGNYILVSELQYEPGGSATPFERTNIESEYLKCQRYYETGSQVYTITGTGYYQGFFKTPKRATPSLTLTPSVGSLTSSNNSTDGFYFVYNYSSNTNITLTWAGASEL